MIRKTPNLAEMGVQNPDQIISYTTVLVREDMDVLKIHYKRPKNSFLPKRRRYEFKRIAKPMPGNNLKGTDIFRYEISPILSRAIVELDLILADEKRAIASKQDLIHELEEMRIDIAERIAHLSKSIESLE